jgi:hypothetical protein
MGRSNEWYVGPMKKLTWWFRVTGIVYIILGLSWLPGLDALSFGTKIENFDAPVGGSAYEGFLDWMMTFGLELLVMGVFLIIAAQKPAKYLPFVWLVVGLETVRGIADDVYMIIHGYSVASNVAFIVLHAAIIVTGVLFARAFSKSGAKAAAPAA